MDDKQFYLNGLIRSVNSLLSGSGSRAPVYFYLDRYGEALMKSGAADKEADSFQIIRYLLADSLTGTKKETNLVKIYRLSLKAVKPLRLKKTA